MSLYWVVDCDDFPGNALPDDITAERFAELMRDWDLYYPGAVASLANTVAPGEA